MKRNEHAWFCFISPVGRPAGGWRERRYWLFGARFSFPSCEAFERAAARSQLSLGSFLASPERPRMDCNACEFCLDKPRFGGAGRSAGARPRGLHRTRASCQGAQEEAAGSAPGEGASKWPVRRRLACGNSGDSCCGCHDWNSAIAAA